MPQNTPPEPASDPFSVALNDAIRTGGDVPVPDHGLCSWGSEPHIQPAAWRRDGCRVQSAHSAARCYIHESELQTTFWLVVWPSRVASQPLTGCVVLLDEAPSIETIGIAASIFALGGAIEIRGNNIADVVAFHDRLCRAAEPLGHGNIRPDDVADRCLIFDAMGFAVGADGPHAAAYSLYSWPNGRTVALLDKELAPGLTICLGFDGRLSTQARQTGARILSIGLPVGVYGHNRTAVDAVREELLATHRPAMNQ